MMIVYMHGVFLLVKVEPYGAFKGKVSLSVLDRLRDQSDGK